MSLIVALQPSLGPALVVGGGAVAARKVHGLLAAGFQLQIVAPAISAEIAGAGVAVAQRDFHERDIEGMALVFACTDDRETNRRVGLLSRAAGILVNVADARNESTFHSLAVYRGDGVQVGVSTHGLDPAGAARTRDRIAEALTALHLEESAP